jgi:iron complex outermembrane receptor protein
MVRGKTSAGNYLPFMPADRIEGSLKANMPFMGKDEGAYVSLGGEYYFKQDRPAQFETPTPAYFLLNANAGVSIQQQNNHSLDIGLTGTNLTNKAYFDALSRFKDLSILNPGIDINLNLTYKF